MNIENKITLEDDFTSELMEIIEHTKDFQRQIQEAKERVDELNKIKATTKIAADTKEAVKGISETKKQINEIKKNVAITIAAKDSASKSIRRIKMEAKEAISKPFTAVIKAKDEVSGVIKKITDKVFNLKTAMAGLVLAGTGKGLYDWTLGAAGANEQQLATMQVMMKSKQGGSDMMGWAYKEAMDTSFKTSDVVNATSLLTTTRLDPKKYFLPVANLKAANKNASFEEIVHDLSLLKNGQSGDALAALESYGVGRQDIMDAGGKFNGQGQLTNVSGIKAVDMVTNIIQSKFGGLTQEHANTAQGLMDRGHDYIEQMGRGLAGIDNKGGIMKGGLFDNFKKELTVIIPLLDKVQKSKAFSEVQKEIGNLATAGGSKLTAFLKSFDNPAKVKQYGNTIKSIGSDIKAVGTVGISFIKGASSVLIPLIKLAAAHPKVIAGVFAGITVGKGALNIVTTFRSISKEFPILNTAIKTFTSGAIGSLGKFFNLLRTNPTVLIIGAIIGACVLLYEAWTHNWGGIRDKTHEVIEFVKTKIDSVKETFENVKKHASDFVAEVEKIWDGLKKFFEHPIQGTIKLVKEGATWVENKIGGKALGTSYFEGGLTWIDEFGPELIDLPAGSKVYNNRQTMNMLNMNKNMRAQAPNMNFSTGVAKQAEQAAPQSVKWGKDIPTNLAKGIKDNTNVVVNATTLMASEIKKLIHFSKPDKGPLADADTYGGDMVKNLGTGVQNNLRYATVPTTNMTSNTKSIVTGLIQQCPTLGQQVVQELGAGIQASTSNLVGIVKTLTDKVIEQFKSGFGIHSPSVIMFKMGNYLMQGLINGMTAKDVKAFINKWIGDITGSVGGNVSGWISAALAITGSPMSWLPKLLDIASRESGNPGQLGTGNASLMNSGPGSASGLMQCMPSTFAEFALPGLGDIFNPIANAVAAIRYIKSRYGSPENIYTGPGYKGYATGLKRVPYDNFPALLHEDEEVITGSKARGNKENGAKIIIQKLADKIIVRNDSDIDKIADALYKKLEKAAYNMA